MKALVQNLRKLVRAIIEEWRFYQRDWSLPGFRAMAVYRFGVWQQDIKARGLRMVFFFIYRALYRYVRNHYGIELYYTTKVGRRVTIAHQGGIVIHPQAEIGDFCMIRQNVTIGAVASSRSWEAPKLGVGVQVGSGAAILGKVTIGDRARIGPNVVVIAVVPAGASVFVAAPRMIRSPNLEKPVALENKDAPRESPITDESSTDLERP